MMKIMQRSAMASISVIAVLLAATSAIAARSHKTVPKCPPVRAHAHVLVADEQAMVYLRPAMTPSPARYEQAEIFGCTYGDGRPYALGLPPEFSSEGGGGIDHETLAGSVVAYQQVSVGKTVAIFRVIVRDLRNGRVLHRLPTGTLIGPESKEPESLVGVGHVVALVVKSDGAVAWIVENGQTQCGGPKIYCYEVHAVDASGERLLASGPEIEPSSLALAGSTLYWTQGGKPSSAVLN
jgi:hypothetical protein